MYKPTFQISPKLLKIQMAFGNCGKSFINLVYKNEKWGLKINGLDFSEMEIKFQLIYGRLERK